MRLIVRPLFILILCVFSFSVQAQLEKLFISYGCRFHEAVFSDELNSPVADTLSKVTDDALTVEEADESFVEDELTWKGWRTVDNYTYGKDRGTMPMIVELNALHPYFRDKIFQLINTCKAQGI